MERSDLCCDKRLVGLFAGAFSPVHLGHIHMIKESIQSGVVGKIIVVPASDAYPKIGLMPSIERLRLLEAELREINGVTISKVEIEKSYWPEPMDTAREIEEKYLSSAEILVWILGGDRLDWLANNSNLTRIVESYPLLIFDRQPYTKNLLLEYPLVSSLQSRMIFLPINIPTISSTQIRQNKQHE